MMKVLIVGAGGQGGACASILARQESVEAVSYTHLDVYKRQEEGWLCCL